MIYNDTRDKKNDINDMISALDRCRDIIEEKFTLLQIAMEYRKSGIHYIFDTQVRGRVEKDTEEVHIAVSGKIEELAQKEGEAPGDHRKRAIG